MMQETTRRDVLSQATGSWEDAETSGNGVIPWGLLCRAPDSRWEESELSPEPLGAGVCPCPRAIAPGPGQGALKPAWRGELGGGRALRNGISADSGKGSTDFSLGGEKGREENGASPAGKASPYHEKTWKLGKVWLNGVCKGGNFGGICRQYLRIVRALQYPVTECRLPPESRQALCSVCPGDGQQPHPHSATHCFRLCSISQIPSLSLSTLICKMETIKPTLRSCCEA